MKARSDQMTSVLQANAAPRMGGSGCGGAVKLAAEQLVRSGIPLQVLHALDLDAVLKGHDVATRLGNLCDFMRILMHPAGRRVLVLVMHAHPRAGARTRHGGGTNLVRAPLGVPGGLGDDDAVHGATGPADVLGEVRLCYPCELDDTPLLRLIGCAHPVANQPVELRPQDVVQGLLGVEVHLRGDPCTCLESHSGPSSDFQRRAGAFRPGLLLGAWQP
mmetsp:Transcript_28849/g.65179  ORF Transcript_28849/g.65179 Transcript_28849/m.65179 type:complete len:218 (+) Transcript_28849:164-817(+)